MGTPCSQYDAKTSSCKSGFPRIHTVCWGGNTGCPTCGNVSSQPMCMQDEFPKHLAREDGLPIGWPVAKGDASDE